MSLLRRSCVGRATGPWRHLLPCLLVVSCSACKSAGEASATPAESLAAPEVATHGLASKPAAAPPAITTNDGALVPGRSYEVAVVAEQPTRPAASPTGARPTPKPAPARLSLLRRGDTLYDLRLIHGQDTTELRGVDLRPFVPKVPRLAAGDEALTALALVERERSRVETTYDGLGEAGLRARIANNALGAGRWELAVELPQDGGFSPIFRGYFTFPKKEYALLFDERNGPGAWKRHGATLRELPKLVSGHSLNALRKVGSERALPMKDVRVHFDEPVVRFGEQERKRGLLLAKGVRTYLDFLAPLRQPVSMAQLIEPGRYSRRNPLKFSFSHLGSPLGAAWRRVLPLAKGVGALMEVELRFHDGQRIVFAAADLGAMPVRTGAPANALQARSLTFGIGTPPALASAIERARPEGDEYLFLADENGESLDPRQAGLDGVLLWREGQGKAGRLHVWLMAYERIAIVAHLSIPFSPIVAR